MNDYTLAMHILTLLGVVDFINDESPAPFTGSVALRHTGNVRLVVRFVTSSICEFAVWVADAKVTSFSHEDFDTALDVCGEDEESWQRALRVVSRMSDTAFDAAVEVMGAAAA